MFNEKIKYTPYKLWKMICSLNLEWSRLAYEYHHGLQTAQKGLCYLHKHYCAKYFSTLFVQYFVF